MAGSVVNMHGRLSYIENLLFYAWQALQSTYLLRLEPRCLQFFYFGHNMIL